jgi:hypothetical protein
MRNAEVRILPPTVGVEKAKPIVVTVLPEQGHR